MTGSSSEESESLLVESTRPAAPPPAGTPRRGEATLVQPLPRAISNDAPGNSPAAPHLLLLSGAQSGKQVWFRAPVTTIGRAQDNAVILPDIAVSRHHARFERAADAVVLRDERSGNGTRVNGRRTKRRSLRDGDVVQVGATRLRFVDPSRRRSATIGYAAAAVAMTVIAAAGVRVVRQRHQAAPQIESAEQVQTNEAKRDEGAAAPPAVTVAVTTAPAVDVTDTVRGTLRAARSFKSPVTGAVAGPRAVTAVRVTAPAPAHPVAAAALHGSAPRARVSKGRSQLEPVPQPAASAAPAADAMRFEEARREGMARLAENKLPEALRAFEEARRENPTPELARMIASLHVRSGLSLMSTDAGLPAAAAELHAALDDQPQDERAARGLQEIEVRCHELYLRGYVAKDEDPAAAKSAFAIVISALPPADQTAQKARHWLEKLGGKAPIDD